MAASKIKKKATGGKSVQGTRQGAIPCLIIIFLVLAVVGFLFFASIRMG